MELIPESNNLSKGFFVGFPTGGSEIFMRKDLAAKVPRREHGRGQSVEYNVGAYRFVSLTTDQDGMVCSDKAFQVLQGLDGQGDPLQLAFPYTRDGEPRKPTWINKYGSRKAEDKGTEVKYRRAMGDVLKGSGKVLSKLSQTTKFKKTRLPSGRVADVRKTIILEEVVKACTCDVSWCDWTCMNCWFACCSKAECAESSGCIKNYTCTEHGPTSVNLDIANRTQLMQVPILARAVDIVECREMKYYRKHGKFPDPEETWRF